MGTDPSFGGDTIQNSSSEVTLIRENNWKGEKNITWQLVSVRLREIRIIICHRRPRVTGLMTQKSGTYP